jgi:hypothetical protein
MLLLNLIVLGLGLIVPTVDMIDAVHHLSSLHIASLETRPPEDSRSAGGKLRVSYFLAALSFLARFRLEIGERRRRHPAGPKPATMAYPSATRDMNLTLLLASHITPKVIKLRYGRSFALETWSTCGTRQTL